MNDVKNFFNEVANNWDERSNHKHINEILEIIKIKENIKILDVACGTGILENYLLKYNPKEILGIDFSENMIKVAERKNNNCKVKYLCDDIFNLVEQLNLKERVFFAGKVNDDELKYLYKNAKLFTYLSFYEGFGLSPLEAMSFQVPTIVSNVTSIPEVVGNMAVKVNPSDIKILSYEIYKLLEDEHYILNSKENIIKESMKIFFVPNLSAKKPLMGMNKAKVIT